MVQLGFESGTRHNWREAMTKVIDGTTYAPPSEELRKDFEAQYADMDLKELAQAFVNWKEEHQKRKEWAAKAYHEWNYIRFKIPELMEEMGMSTAKFNGIGRVQLSHQASCKQKDFNALTEWMKKHGHEDLIKETINSSSLNAFIKAQIAAGEEIPSDDIIEFKPYTVGSVVKA